jgi:threonine/homoserine/homoserine lactone efflux protein
VTASGDGHLGALGIGEVRRVPPGRHRGQAVIARSATVRSGGPGVSGLNPKALLLFLALLRQFITRSPAWPLAAQIVLLGLVHTANCAVIYTSGGHHGTAGTADTSSRRQSGDLLFTIEVQDG